MAYTNVVVAAGAQWSATTSQVDPSDGVVLIANADPNRRAVTVFTDPDNSVGALWLVPNAGQRTGGIRLTVGAGYEFGHGSAIYAYAETGTVIVHVVTESGAVC